MPSTTACPSNETIAELVCRQLGDARANELEVHIADCAPCRRLVGTLAAGTLPRLVGTAASTAEPVRGDDQRYVVREELARGGMGRISIAFDTVLGRMVAIKELLAPNAALAARFQRELALTSRLQHPSIVNIHDGGTWSSGEPFYVMRLVSGRPLDRVSALDDDVAARLGLLPHGIAMVDAIAYAHSQGIIHRDLKPANVLVGDFGETVVIDWGLAKDLRATAPTDEPAAPVPMDGAATIAGLVIGTPAYMAPEQARGEAADERSDVYALGAVLYHLLGGRAPYVGSDVEGIVRAVRSEPPRPLAEVAAGIPVDLVTIVGKAMATRAADRYPTASELATDLKRFQRGQLVAAHRYSSWQLLARWLRKHRTAVGVAAIALVAVIAITAAAFARVTSAQHGAESARGDAEDLMQFMLTDLRHKLEPLGKVKLLDDVATKAVAYYDRRSGALSDVEALGRAEARRSLGDVLAAEGHAEDALREYRAALEIDQPAAAADPGSADHQRSLATSHRKVGSELLVRGDASGALAELRAATAILEEQVRRTPTSDLQRELATCRVRMGDVLLARADAAGATAAYRAALAIDGRLAALDPANTEYQTALASAHGALGAELTTRGDLPAALIELHAAVAIEQALVAKDPASVIWQTNVSAGHDALGCALRTSGDLTGALGEFRLELASAEPHASADPLDTSAQVRVALAHQRIGDILYAQGDGAGALAQHATSLEIDRKLAAEDPTNTDIQTYLAADHERMGTMYLMRGEHAHDDRDGPRALDEYRASLAIYETMAATDPSNSSMQAYLWSGHNHIGVVLDAMKDARQALASFRRAMAIMAALAVREPASPIWQASVGVSHEYIGDELLALHDPAAALAEYRQYQATSEALAVKDPVSEERRRDLVESHERVGDALFAEGDRTGPRVEYAAAMTIARALLANQPANPEHIDKVSALAKKLAKVR